MHNKKSLHQITPLYESNKNIESIKMYELQMESDSFTEEED